MVKFLLCALVLLSASVASAQCPGGVCIRKPFLSVRAPAGASVHASWRPLRGYRVYVNSQGVK